MSKAFLRAINVAALCLGSLAYAAEESPPWAYPTPPPGYKPSADDGSPRLVPESHKTYSTPQVRDLFLAPDWHPEPHPQMPPIVAMGRKPEVFACGFCAAWRVVFALIQFGWFDSLKAVIKPRPGADAGSPTRIERN